MKCPYDNSGCDGVDTSGMDKIACEYCYRYHNGVRATGAMPLLEKLWKRLRKKKYEPTDEDIFMMGL